MHQQLRAEEDRGAEDYQQHTDGYGLVEVRLEQRVDRQREGLGRALEASREQNRGAEFSDAPGKRHGGSGAEAGSCQRDGDGEHPPQAARAERPGNVEKGRVNPFERGQRAAEIERAGDEQDRQHDGGLAEGEVDAEPPQGVPEQAKAAERDQQREAGHSGRHHKRQLDDGDEHTAPGEPPAGD